MWPSIHRGAQNSLQAKTGKLDTCRPRAAILEHPHCRAAAHSHINTAVTTLAYLVGQRHPPHVTTPELPRGQFGDLPTETAGSHLGCLWLTIHTPCLPLQHKGQQRSRGLRNQSDSRPLRHESDIIRPTSNPSFTYPLPPPEPTTAVGKALGQHQYCGPPTLLFIWTQTSFGIICPNIRAQVQNAVSS